MRILFVDDEPNVLQGTRRATRDMRQEWDMHFVGSGEEALLLIADSHFDVVVSDMRMPGMDGAQLLGQVRDVSPSTARVILSGYAEEEAVFRSTRVAHQFLSKPCDAALLKRTIADIVEAQQTVPSEQIRELVGRVDQLPALGDVYERLVAAVESGQADNEQLARIIDEDVALTAQVLRLVNTAFFGLNRRVESVAQAIGFLGFDVLRAIVAGYSVFGSSDSSVLDIDAVSRRCHEVAGLTRRIHRVLHAPPPAELAEAYLAGMLHEVGALVLSTIDDVDPVDIRGVLESNDVTNERLLFRVDRFAVGGYLLGLWAFPLGTVRAVSALSHLPGQFPPTSDLGWSLVLARHAVINGLPPSRPDVDGDRLDSAIIELDGQCRDHFSTAMELSE